MNNTAAARRLNSERVWPDTLAAVDQTADKVGRDVDAGIKATVAALWLHKFPTTGSCEGHLERTETFPYIDIWEAEPEGRKEDESKDEVWRHANLLQQQRLLALLSEFYRHRVTAFDATLCIDQYSFGRFRLHSLGAPTIGLLEDTKRKERLSEYLREMRDFTRFLRERWMATADRS